MLPDQRRELYTGLTAFYSLTDHLSSQDHPHVDLEADVVSHDGILQIWLDIDSAGGFATNLVVARAGLQWKAGRAAVSNLCSGLHLPKIPVQWYDSGGDMRQSCQSVHQVPYLPFGRLAGFPEVEIYLLFLHLYEPQREYWVIINDEFKMWTDKILMPALHVAYPAPVLSHLPFSVDYIALNSTAARIEGQALPEVHVPKAQDLHYMLAPSGLRTLWNWILERME